MNKENKYIQGLPTLLKSLNSRAQMFLTAFFN